MEKEFNDLEIWDYIKGYENYKVSSKGQVFSTKSKKIIKPHDDSHGYHSIRLYQDGKGKTHKVHRLVALTFYFMEDTEGKIIDHIDRCRTNNNLLNLRFCTQAENSRNRIIQSNNQSGYKGIFWSKQNKKWSSQIALNGKSNHLGYFKTKEEALEAYKKASKEYHGDFGYAP